MKNLAAIYRVENASLIDEKLIQECYNSKIDEHLEVKRTENLI
jgi:hypothetical protein